MAQMHTGADTSINTTPNKLPELYNKKEFESGAIVVDYGCGKETRYIKERAEKNGCVWYGCDKYNQPDTVNKLTEEVLMSGVDYAVCCNVLNVIDDVDEIKDIIIKLIENSKQTIFQIYQKDGNEVGTESKTNPDCWQRNNSTKWYADLITSLGYKVNNKICKSTKYIYCSK